MATRKKPPAATAPPETEITSPAEPLVGIIMGSISDWGTMEHAAEILADFSIPYETRVVSAHRTPDLLVDYAKTAVVRADSYYCRCWGRGAFARDDSQHDAAAGARRAGGIQGAQRHGLAAEYCADARRGAGGDICDRQGGGD